MKKLLILGVLLGGSFALAAPWLLYDTTASATDQNIRMASGANAAGEYGVVVGSNADAAADTPLFAVCEKCDDSTPTYVWTIDSDGDWTLDSSAPLLTTTSSAAGLNLGVASGANASGEYGVSLGTTAAAAAGLELVGFGVDLDGTPIYAAQLETIAAGGTGFRLYSTATAAGQNASMTSGANAAGEYGAVVGTDAAVTDGTQVFAACSDCDGTPTYQFTVSSDGNLLLDATAPIVSTASSVAGLNFALASGANASGEYGVSMGTNVAGAAGLELVGWGSDLDGTPVYAGQVETIAADGTGFRLYSAATATGQNASMTSGANAAGEYGAVVGTDAAVSDTTQAFAVCTDCDDATPDYRFTVLASGALTITGDATADAGLAGGFDFIVAAGASAAAGSSLPSFTASPSATATPTATPKASPTASPSARVSLPSTASGVPTSGTLTPTLVLFILGLALMSLGVMGQLKKGLIHG